MKVEKLTFITGNAAKAEQLGRHLEYPVAHKKADAYEIQSLDLRQIAEHKAREAQRQIGGTVLVEDTSLVFHALSRLPGPLIKWFLEELDNAGLAKLLNGYNDRNCTASVCFALCDGESVEFFEGERKGAIALEPRGERGFGWDPIFIPEGHETTWGEMDPAGQEKTSMRRVALKKLEEYLRALQGS